MNFFRQGARKCTPLRDFFQAKQSGYHFRPNSTNPCNFLITNDIFRSSKRYYGHFKPNSPDYVIVGAGHNGLVCANYLKTHDPHARIVVLERRDIVGGAAITEEIIPGFKFSRASYLCALLRPQIINDLKLRDYITLLPRNPSSFSPTLEENSYLMLGPSMKKNQEQIAKFSKKDAEQLPRYEAMLEKFANVMEHLIDVAPFDPKDGSFDGSSSTLKNLWNQRESASVLLNQVLKELGVSNIPEFYQILTSPASKLLRQYFESEPLLATLSTDAIIGEFIAPSTPGSAYVLLHHVMGNVLGEKETRGIWCYVKGGMGAISESLAQIAKSNGIKILTNSPVSQILLANVSGKSSAQGVVLEDGTEIWAKKAVISNCNADTTFLKLIPEPEVNLPKEFREHVQNIDYSSATCKINLAVSKLPTFKCVPEQVQSSTESPSPYHTGTIHFAGSLDAIEKAYMESKMTGKPCSRPVIEMTIPSVLDDSVSPPGKHVVQLFVQYAPYDYFLTDNDTKKKAFAESCYKVIDEYCPGFSSSILGEDILSPVDLERIIDLKGGNIFHGSIALNQLYFMRPAPGFSRYETPIKRLYLCGSSAHPGGGVMGAPGRLCAHQILKKK